MRRPRRPDRATPGGTPPPPIGPPRGLSAYELEADGERFALLEWSTAPAAKAPRPGLTPAEAAVAELAASGRSNAEIGAARGAAARTVANQLASAFRKIGVRSRAELCARLWTDAPSRGDRR